MKTVILTVLACIALVSAFSVPTPGREWYIGGAFTKAYNADGSSVDANNIVAWRGSENKWRAMSTGTNGRVNYVHSDTCRTLYIGGSFTTASGQNTGPIAKWTFNSASWAPAFEGTNPFGPGAVVNSISTDCANFDIKNLNPLNCVPCDVFIAGSFNITVGGVTGYNVAKWVAKTKSWDLLAPTGAGAPKAADTVYTVYKKAYGVTESAKFVWLGGSFDNGATSLKKYKLNDGAWDAAVPAFPGVIKALYYDPGLFTTDEIYVGGGFDNTVTGGGRCTNVCKFDYKQNSFSQVGASNRPGPTGEVLSLQLSSSNLYAAGSFTGTVNYLSTIVESNVASNAWGGLSNTAGITGPLSSITLCNSADAGCTTGSIAMVGPNGFMSFYNAQSKNYEQFGNKTNGDVRTITSLYTIYSAAPLAQVSIFAAVAMMLLLLLSL